MSVKCVTSVLNIDRRATLHLPQVRPWVVDITSDVETAHSSKVFGDTNNSSNATNSITYRGLFGGKDPQASTTAGYIMMESNLVFLRDGNWTADD
jgi:endo-1,4-beta-mannosidase